MREVAVGLEVCLAEPPEVLRRGRFGLLANQASLDRRFRYAWDVLAEEFPGRLAAIFSPQHGLWGEQQANMIETGHAMHPRLGVPVHSLYSETRRPTPEMLERLDCLVVDLQDVGTRIYTFAWTVANCLRACADAGIPVVILDRPNPLGGVAVEGPVLEPEYRSFVGDACIPMRHGLTLGELASLINAEERIGADLTVVPMRGWSRSMLFPDTGRTWVVPSPNLPRFEGVLLYPGQVLLEGTNLSEGRGTTTPFEVAGAPYVDPNRIAEELTRYELPGLALRPVRFQPTFDKWRGESCGGVALHVTDAAAVRPYRTAVALLAVVSRLWPEDFQFLPPPYEYETEKMPIDILSGGPQLREWLATGSKGRATELEVICAVDESGWEARISAHVLYR